MGCLALAATLVIGHLRDGLRLGLELGGQKRPEVAGVEAAADSDFSQPPALVFVAFIRCRPVAVLVTSNVSPALPEPSARSSWLIPMMRYSSVLPFVSFIENFVPASIAAFALA